MEQTAVRCVIMRAGTSKGLFFHERDLPPSGPERDGLLLRIMGSPDLLQIDGLGGSRPITSKVAIVAQSMHEGADVDYTFAQVEIERASVTYDANCGNICSGVGPFAIDERLVTAVEGVTRVRILNTNTRKMIVADVPTTGGVSRISGSCSIPGVPGTGAEIRMNWVDTIGSSTGHLLPTGNPVDSLRLEDGRSIAVSLCDAANPCVWVAAAEVGFPVDGRPQEINSDAGLTELLHEVRGKAAVLFGFCKDWRRARSESPTVPFVGLVAPPTPYRTLADDAVLEPDMDVVVRLMFMDRLHESIAGTGSICLAAASRIPGSVVHAMTRPSKDVLRIGHPSGVTATRVKVHAIEAAPFVHFEELGFSRTARRLLAGEAYVPSPGT